MKVMSKGKQIPQKEAGSLFQILFLAGCELLPLLFIRELRTMIHSWAFSTPAYGDCPKRGAVVKQVNIVKRFICVFWHEQCLLQFFRFFTCSFLSPISYPEISVDGGTFLSIDLILHPTTWLHFVRKTLRIPKDQLNEKTADHISCLGWSR